MPFKQHVKQADVAVIGESEVAYSACLPLGCEEIEHTVVDVAGVELFERFVAHPYGVEQHVIYVVGLEQPE